MALYHVATLTPTKAELLAAWVPTQPWGPPADSSVDVIGAYRFDDPEGQVGMESFIVRSGDAVFHVPLTYREAPLSGAAGALVTEMQHSALGTRYVYDGLRDPLFVRMLAAVTMTGQGEALGMVVYEGRWVIAPAAVRIHGGGWSGERVAVDGFEAVSGDVQPVVFHNDRFELTVWRRPPAGPKPAIGLVASWDGQPDPVVLTQVREL